VAKPHGVLREAVIDLTESSISAEEALASATGRAADAIGLGDRTGRLRAGLAADLLIVDGNPMTDPTALRNVRTVVARGRLVVTT
jgi:imidazolonepropionase-like amidohydrolase